MRRVVLLKCFFVECNYVVVASLLYYSSFPVELCLYYILRPMAIFSVSLNPRFRRLEWNLWNTLETLVLLVVCRIWIHSTLAWWNLWKILASFSVVERDIRTSEITSWKWKEKDYPLCDTVWSDDHAEMISTLNYPIPSIWWTRRFQSRSNERQIW